jgi:hypothetical protein
VTKLRSNLPLRIAGLAAGVMLAASLLYVLRFPPSNGRLGADVRVETIPVGDLTVTPRDAFLTGRGLKPGSPPVSGELKIRNITPKAGNVRIQALPSDRALARLMHMELSSGGHVLADGSIDSLRVRRSLPLRIPSGQARTLHAKVWLPRGIKRGYQAGLADVPLDLRTQVLDGPR